MLILPLITAFVEIKRSFHIMSLTFSVLYVKTKQLYYQVSLVDKLNKIIADSVSYKERCPLFFYTCLLIFDGDPDIAFVVFSCHIAVGIRLNIHLVSGLVV